jgi:hypothetical protein
MAGLGCFKSEPFIMQDAGYSSLPLDIYITNCQLSFVDGACTMSKMVPTDDGRHIQ